MENRKKSRSRSNSPQSHSQERERNWKILEESTEKTKLILIKR